MTTIDHPADIETIFVGRRVMAVLRNRSPQDTVALTHSAFDLGIDLVEVPIQSPAAIPALEASLGAARDRGRGVGAGTVTTVEQVELCARLGVTFTVAPGLDAAVVRRSIELGIPHLPGVATATEIQHAVALGCTWLKAFPATQLGAPWFHAMVSGPFPAVRLFASGGISTGNAHEFLTAGASGVAVGSALEDANQLDALSRLVLG